MLLSTPVFKRDARCIPSHACNQAGPFWRRPPDIDVPAISKVSSRKHEQFALCLFLSAKYRSGSSAQEFPDAERHSLGSSADCNSLGKKRNWEPSGPMSGSNYAGEKGRIEQSIRKAKPKDHFASLRVQRRISGPPPNEILLVDDIITRGSTLLGAANRLAEAFPEARIRAFGAMATVSDPADFVALSRPLVGSIQYRPSTEDTIRRP